MILYLLFGVSYSASFRLDGTMYEVGQISHSLPNQLHCLVNRLQQIMFCFILWLEQIANPDYIIISPTNIMMFELYRKFVRTTVHVFFVPLIRVKG